MARVNNIATALQNVKTIEDLRRFVGAALDSIIAQLNGKLDFGDNLRTFGPIEVAFLSGIPIKVQHGLGRTPIGYLVTTQRVGNGVIIRPNADLYPWTDTQVFLACTADEQGQVMVF